MYRDAYVPSGMAQARVYYPEGLKHSDEQYAKILLKLSEGNKAFGRAFGYLRSAWRLRDMPLDDPAIYKALS
jgi:hypothetical protein